MVGSLSLPHRQSRDGPGLLRCTNTLSLGARGLSHHPSLAPLGPAGWYSATVLGEIAVEEWLSIASLCSGQ